MGYTTDDPPTEGEDPQDESEKTITISIAITARFTHVTILSNRSHTIIFREKTQAHKKCLFKHHEM